MFTRLLATTALTLGLVTSGYADDAKTSKDGHHGQMKSAEDVAHKLHKLNNKEIECGKLGQRKSENPEVKEFARMVESDHTRANEQVRQFAASKGIELKKLDDAHGDHKGREGEPGEPGSVGTPGTQGTPGNQTDVEDRAEEIRDSDGKDIKHAKRDDKEKMKRLEALSGEEFDREYTTMMAHAHGKAIRMLTDAQAHVEDAEAKELILALLPDLQKHWEQAAALSRKFGGNPDAATEADPSTR